METAFTIFAGAAILAVPVLVLGFCGLLVWALIDLVFDRTSDRLFKVSMVSLTSSFLVLILCGMVAIGLNAALEVQS